RRCENDARSFSPRPALHPDASAMRFDDAARNGESHSQPFWSPQTRRAFAGRAEEFIEDALAKRRRYAAPFVLNGNHYHLILSRAGGDFYQRAGRRIFRGVVNQ